MPRRLLRGIFLEVLAACLHDLSNTVASSSYLCILTRVFKRFRQEATW
jgi:hypothetical protein